MIDGIWLEDEDDTLLEVVATALNEDRVSLSIQEDGSLDFDQEDIEVIRLDLASKGIRRMPKSIESRLGGQVGNIINTSIVLDDGGCDEAKPSAARQQMITAQATTLQPS